MSLLRDIFRWVSKRPNLTLYPGFWEKIASRRSTVKGIPDPSKRLPRPAGYSRELRNLALNTVLIKWVAPRGYKSEYGSGFMVGPNLIVTAAHIAEFYNRSSGYVRMFYKDQIGRPEHWATPRKVYMHRGYKWWLDHTDRDIGLIVTDSLDYKEVNLAPSPRPADLKDLHTLCFWGPYATQPGVEGYDEQYESTGQHLIALRDMAPYIEGAHNAPTYSRWSGSAVLRRVNGVMSMIGVHAYYYDKQAGRANLFAGFTRQICDQIDNVKVGAPPDDTQWRKIWP